MIKSVLMNNAYEIKNIDIFHDSQITYMMT